MNQEFTVYGADGCSFCVKAKDFLMDRVGEEHFSYVDIAMDEDARSFLRDELKVRQIPQVFCGDQHIGGYQELVKYLS